MTVGRTPLIQIFYNTCDPLSPAHTGGHNTIFFLQSFQVVDDLDGQFTACTAERMPKGDGSAIDVDDVRIDAQLTDDGQRLGGKGLVELYQADIGEAHPHLAQCLWYRLDRADTHDTG